MKKGTRISPEKIVSVLREAEALRANGKSVAEATREIGVSEQTYYRWKRAYGGMDKPELTKLKELEKENARLKKLVADLALDKSILEEVVKGKF